MQALFVRHQPQTPLLINVPHAGTYLPDDISNQLNATALGVADTDWFVDRLWSWATEMGAGLQCATHSRYVVDLNRPPDDTPLYTSATTGLVPLQDFAGEPLYPADHEPAPEEVARRLNAYWRPYHQALAETLAGMKQQFGFAILLDAHSIASRVPMLFEGKLPDLNLGTNGGTSAAPGLTACAWSVLSAAEGFSSVHDGRFRGGYITRHYGQPEQGVHALQLEVAQCAYMQENPPKWDDARAEGFRDVQQALIQALQGWQPDG